LVEFDDKLVVVVKGVGKVKPAIKLARIRSAVWKIHGKEQAVLLFRYGLMGRKMDLLETSKMVKTSREGVRILQIKGLNRLAEILGCPGQANWLHNRLSGIGGNDA
jgi:DNA-directed RNA polymerase sigma subunit (sigma70/sigma32)